MATTFRLSLFLAVCAWAIVATHAAPFTPQELALRNAITSAAKTVVFKLTKAVYLTESLPLIPAGKNLTIIGACVGANAPACNINGGNLFRGFTYESKVAGYLTIKNIHFNYLAAKPAKADKGACIDWNGPGIVHVISTVFARNGPHAVKVTGRVAFIASTGTKWWKNRGKSSGAAIYTGDALARVHLYNSYVWKSHAPPALAGASIYVLGDLLIWGGLVKHTYVEKNDGAVYVGGNAVFKGVDFSLNRAFEGNVSPIVIGGNKTAYICGCFFKDNYIGPVPVGKKDFLGGTPSKADVLVLNKAPVVYTHSPKQPLRNLVVLPATASVKVVAKCPR